MKFKKLEQYLAVLEQSFGDLDQTRISVLKEIRDAILVQLKGLKVSNLIFICTHNSRRSQIAELFSHIAFRYYGLPNINSYSGGTEQSSFFPHAVQACIEKGCTTIQKSGSIVNHTYLTAYKYHLPVIVQFSKTYEDKFNPQSDFIAVMVCDHADENCPFIPGADKRISLNYVDPKHADNDDNVLEVYSKKVDEIATEMLYLAKLVKEAIS